jgi:hypothetical protein
MIAQLEACLKQLGAPYTIPEKLRNDERAAFLTGVLSAAVDSIGTKLETIDDDDDEPYLIDDEDPMTARFAEGYCALSERFTTVAESMAVRLLCFSRILQRPEMNRSPRSPKKAAFHAIRGTAMVLTSFDAPREYADPMLSGGWGELSYSLEHLTRFKPEDMPGPGVELTEEQKAELAKAGDVFEAERLEQIGKYGFYTQYVGEDPASGDPQYAYTVGLSSQDKYGYEFAISGLSPTGSHAFLWNAVRAIEKFGITPDDAVEVPEVGAGDYKVRLRAASTNAQFGMIEQLLGERSAVWQLMCPDEQGRYPGNPAYAPRNGFQILL